ncbi:MAG: TolC family protein [Chitinophagaceae bacterium]|nr:TolC family protein [Chitinophagaceae bacterium]
MKKLSSILNKTGLYTVLMLLALSCKTKQAALTGSLIALPETYLNQADSVNTGMLTREQFFGDTVLQQLIDTAIKNNLSLKSGIERILIARANLLVHRGLRLPRLDGFAAGAMDRYGKYTMSGVGNFDTNLSSNISEKQKVTDPAQDYFLGLRSSWEIDIWGKLKDRKRAAYHSLQATGQERIWLTTQLVAQVASYYYELLALDNRLEIIHRNITLQERAVEIVKAQMEGGRSNSLAVQQFSANLFHTRSLEHTTRLDIIRLENELNGLLGRYAQTPVPRGQPLQWQPLPVKIAAGVPADLLTHRPDIQQAEQELEASKANLVAARKAFLPSITISAHAGINAFKLPLLFDGASLAYGLLGGITQPLFSQFQTKAGYDKTHAEQSIAFNNYQQRIIQGFGEVLTGLKDIEHYTRILELNQSEVQALTDAVSSSNELYLNGYASYLEVITAQKGVLEAELNRTATQKELLYSYLNLYRALGGGWE